MDHLTQPTDRAESLAYVPSAWFEPGAVIPVSPETVMTLMRALKASQARIEHLDRAVKDWQGRWTAEATSGIVGGYKDGKPVW